MSDDELVRVKASVSTNGGSAEIRLSKDTAGVMAMLFPTSAAKRRARSTVAGRILKKLADGASLDDADLEYAEEIFGDAEAKWARKHAVAQRAEALLNDEGFAGRRLPPSSDTRSERPQTKPDSDWANRLFEDVGVVTDEVLAEVYARVLASEIQQPGQSSKQTLGVLRDLDRSVADLFGKALSIAVGSGILRNDELLKEVGLTFSGILAMDSAGLLDSSNSLEFTIFKGGAVVLTCANRLIQLNNAEGVGIPVYPLSRAGLDLQRVADVTCNDARFKNVLNFLVQLVKGRAQLKLAHAKLPHRTWQGPVDELSWTDVLSGEENAPR